MRESELRREHSPIVELIGLVEAQRLLQARISECVAACCEHGYGATEVARILPRTPSDGLSAGCVAKAVGEDAT